MRNGPVALGVPPGLHIFGEKKVMPELNFVNGLHSIFVDITGKEPKKLEGSDAIFEDLGHLISDHISGCASLDR